HHRIVGGRFPEQCAVPVIEGEQSAITSPGKYQSACSGRSAAYEHRRQRYAPRLALAHRVPGHEPAFAGTAHGSALDRRVKHAFAEFVGGKVQRLVAQTRFAIGKVREPAPWAERHGEPVVTTAG